MNKLFISLSLLTSLIWISACKGPQGDVGPAGTIGTQGTTGTTGVAGPAGNANVVYTAWKTPTWENFGRSPDNRRAFLNISEAGKANAAFTADAINKGVIYTYIKIKALNYDNVNGEYALVERITPQGAYTYAKIPGRQTNTYEDFMATYVGYDPNMAVNYFYPFLQVITERYDLTQQKYVPLEEATGKPAAYFRDLVKDLPQFRHVIVNGSTAGRMAAVNFKDYAAVKKAFNLPD